MKNSLLSTLKTNIDFSKLIDKYFKQPITKDSFSTEYKARRASEDFLKNLPEAEARNITERQLIRDNIFLKYKFDIFEYPIVVFHENGRSKEILKPFKKMNEASNYAKGLLYQNVNSLLISIMNKDIECELFSN